MEYKSGGYLGCGHKDEILGMRLNDSGVHGGDTQVHSDILM